jgi:hypothetical protein
MKINNRMWINVGAALLFMLAVSCAPKKNVDPALMQGPGWTMKDNNLHQVDGPPVGPNEPEQAFRVWRSGSPDKDTFARWCSVYHIERVIDMSGTARDHELKYQAEGVCPGIKVIYSVEQNHEKPLSDGFLEYFDAQVARARADNVGILFRCQTGSHRAGRMAAYYQMKYEGLTADQAIAVMDYNGMLMPLFDPVLRPQVKALSDYIRNQPCSQKKKWCVQQNSDKWVQK